MRLALFGGSFDPPHAGHLAIVREALRVLPISRLIVVPAARNPFKTSVRAEGLMRLKWLQALMSPYEKVEISDFEISQNRAVYTYETVCHFCPKGEKVYLIIGADNLEKLREWHRFADLDALVEWVVATRGDIPIPEGMIPLTIHEPISSTLFRETFETLGIDPKIETEILHYYKEFYESTN